MYKYYYALHAQASCTLVIPLIISLFLLFILSLQRLIAITRVDSYYAIKFHVSYYYYSKLNGLDSLLESYDTINTKSWVEIVIFVHLCQAIYSPKLHVAFSCQDNDLIDSNVLTKHFNGLQSHIIQIIFCCPWTSVTCLSLTPNGRNFKSHRCYLPLIIDEIFRNTKECSLCS